MTVTFAAEKCTRLFTDEPVEYRTLADIHAKCTEDPDFLKQVAREVAGAEYEGDFLQFIGNILSQMEIERVQS